jgi:DNA-binding CsgD family transcriptional regulator
MARQRNAAAQVDDVPADEPRKLRAVGGRRTRGRAAPRRSSKLSGREILVLGELAQGHTTEQIGANLLLSPHTVRTHIKNAMRKLDAHTRAHAVAIALSDRVIKLEA